MSAREVTLSLSHDGRRRGETDAQPFLFLVLHADRPLDAPRRFPLGDVDEVLLGRGEVASAELDTAGHSKRLVVRVPDKRMSSEHARLSRVLDGWMLEDTRSKNGTFIGGEKKARAELVDGDVLELGRTFFIFRTRCEAPKTKSPSFAPKTPGIVTQLPRLVADLELLEEVARSTIPVLLQGESGTGKEIVARLVHQVSARAGDFVPVTCGVLPEQMVETELLGFVKGAFPGATEAKPGLVKSADHGTLFLDDLGDFCASAQSALLRVIDEKEVYAIGSGKPQPVDVRVVASVRTDPERLVEKGPLRPELLSRVRGFTFVLPPLRERREDLGLLVAELLRRHAKERAADVRLAPEAVRALFAQAWPGNVRELDRCLSTALVLAQGGTIELEHVEKALARPRSTAPKVEEPESLPTEPALPASPPLTTASAKRPVLVREGDMWTLSYGHKSTHLADTHGLHYIQWLVEHAGQEIHVLDLFSTVRGEEPRARDLGHAGPALDAEAKRAYRRRVEELREELEEATRWNDVARVERASAELEAIEEELARGVGLGGRDRVQATAAERARANLTARIRKTIKRIEEVHPQLGHHLSACIKTGTFCSYVPPPDG